LFFMVSGMNFISVICLLFIKNSMLARKESETIITERPVIEP